MVAFVGGLEGAELMRIGKYELVALRDFSTVLCGCYILLFQLFLFPPQFNFNDQIKRMQYIYNL
jgi:hypothetical protein